MAAGDKEVVRWTIRGTHTGELMGIPPTGKQVAWTGITIYRLADGKIVEEKGEEDALGFLQQLGVVPGMGYHPNWHAKNSVVCYRRVLSGPIWSFTGIFPLVSTVVFASGIVGLSKTTRWICLELHALFLP